MKRTKRPKMRLKKKLEPYVEYVIQDYPILGKKIVKHQLENNESYSS